MNLHSTMFIFIYLRKSCRWISDIFTFHYVYIYIQAWRCNRWQRLHLHSTMFIFIFKGVMIGIQLSKFTFHYVYIYIPLCMVLYQLCFQIYIPLCLYLYWKHFRRNWAWMHLHSTMFIFILGGESYAKKMAAFTFHYVYIYMYRKLATGHTIHDLHSTMFIFISCGRLRYLRILSSFTFHYVYIYI